MVSRIELPLDIMRIIAAKLLLEKDLVDYIKLRNAFHNWRLHPVSPLGLDFRFRLRHWIMLSEGHDANFEPSSRRFFNLSSGRVLELWLPELNTFSVFSDCDGLLLLIDESTQAVRLFNPLTRRLARLPNLPVFVSIMDNSWTSSISTSSCPSVILFNRHLGSFYFAKPFYSQWLIFRFPACLTPNSMLCFRDQFYFGIPGYGILRFDLQRRELISVISQFDMGWEILNHCYIVEFNGEMLLLHRKRNSSFRVYRVDLEPDGHGLVPMYYNRDLTIFLGERCFAFPLNGQAAEFGLPSLRPNSVYDCAGKSPFISITVCNIGGQLGQPSTGYTFQDLRFLPLSLSQHLAAYSLNSY